MHERFRHRRDRMLYSSRCIGHAHWSSDDPGTGVKLSQAEQRRQIVSRDNARAVRGLIEATGTLSG
jgi:hypothetical protein